MRNLGQARGKIRSVVFRRKDRDLELSGAKQQVAPFEMAFALDGGACLALRQQAAQLPIGRTITRIDDHIRRAVGEGQATADEKPEIALVAKILPCRMCPHHTGQRVAVGNADTGQTKLMRTRYQFLRMRRTAQEGEIAGSSHFEIRSHHANSPCKTSADDWHRHKGLRGKSRSAGRSRLPPGNNRAVPEPCDRLRATIPVRSFPAPRQGAHDGAPAATGKTKAGCRALPPRFRSIVAGETVLWGALAGRWEVLGKCCCVFVIGFALAVRVKGRAQAEGPFRNMRVTRKGNENAVLSKPRRKPVDKLTKPRFIFLMLVEPRLALGDCRTAQRCQPDHVEAETGVERVGQGIEPFTRKAQENLVAAQGLAGFDVDMTHFAIDTEEGGLNQKRAFSLRFKLRKSSCASSCKMRSTSSIAVTGSDRRRSTVLRGMMRKGNRRALLPRQPVEPGRKIGAEAGGECGARKPHHIADAFQSGALEAGFGSLRQFKRGERQAGKQAVGLCSAEDTALRSPCQKSRGKTVIGNRRLYAKPGPFQTPDCIGTHGVEPAKRCAQPVMSSISPCGSSKATSGV